MFDGKAWGEEVVAVVKAYVESQTAPLLARIAILEALILDQPEPVPPPSLDEGRVSEIVREELSHLPAAPEPPPSITVDEIKTLIVEHTPKAIKGDPGDPGKPGEKGDPGSPGERGQDGLNGISLAGAIIDREGVLHLTCSNGASISLGCVVGKNGDPGTPGKDGKDGMDGLGFDDLSVTYDGERSFTFTFQKGDAIKAFTFEVPVMIYRDVFQPAKEYRRGDTVTWAGSLWHCNEITTDMPETSKAWTLAAKRGREGKAGLNGKDLTPPKPVKVS